MSEMGRVDVVFTRNALDVSLKADLYRGSEAPTEPVNNSFWLDTDTGELKQWDGSAWQPVPTKGDQGEAGPAGADGSTSYVHIAYADSSSGSGFSQDPTGKAYMGSYVDFVQMDSTNPADYQWIKVLGPQGIQGLQGPQGSQGIQGPAGANGSPSYLHIAYADNASGSGFTQSPTGKAYIGVYTDSNASDSGNPSAYTWSLIKGVDGLDGADGVPGPAGANGQTSYVHFAYATSADGTVGFSTTDPTNKTYIGTYTDFTQNDSTDPANYAWAKFQGPTGAQGSTGPQGVQGPQGVTGATGATGPQGPTVYTWIKYADTPTTGMSDDPTGKQYMGLAYNKLSATESTNYADYSWARLYDASKKRNFTSTPTTPYDIGDTWTQSGSTYYCTVARASGAYMASDWTLQQINLTSLATAVQSTLNNSLQSTSTYSGVQINSSGMTATAGSTQVKMNSVDGFKITKSGATLFQVDTNGNLSINGAALTVTGAASWSDTVYIGDQTKSSGIYVHDDSMAEGTYVYGTGVRVIVDGTGDRPMTDIEPNYIQVTDGGTQSLISSSQVYTDGNITAGGAMHVNGTDLWVGSASTGRGDGGRALVQQTGNKLVINYAGDFEGGVQIQSDVDMNGKRITGINYLNGSMGTIVQSTDEWLRINGDNTHTSGVYFGTSLVRTDGTLQVDNIKLNGAHSIQSADGGRMYITDGSGANSDLTVRSLTQSSQWSIKENFETIEPNQALTNILNTDVVRYNFKGDTEKHVGLIIDDRATPQYHACDDFITIDRLCKKDDSIIGELMLSIKALNQKIQEQEIRIAQLEAA